MSDLRARTLTRPISRDEQDNVDNWQTEAECRDMSTAYHDPWFPEGTAKSIYDDARAVCNRCPVTELCLAAEMANEGDRPAAVRFGMRGGKTPKERAKLAGVVEPDSPPSNHLREVAARERRARFAARRNRVADLANAGHITRDIADTLGVSVTAVLRDFRLLRAEGRVDDFAGLSFKPGEHCGTAHGVRQHMNARETPCKACRGVAS
jgi:WhiB family redox-sensing transcriptional regulator